MNPIREKINGLIDTALQSPNLVLIERASVISNYLKINDTVSNGILASAYYEPDTNTVKQLSDLLNKVKEMGEKCGVKINSGEESEIVSLLNAVIRRNSFEKTSPVDDLSARLRMLAT